MIAQVLSRSFLLTWLDAVEESLSDLADSGDPEGEYAAALDGIKQVKKSGVQGHQDEAEGDRRSGGTTSRLWMSSRSSAVTP